MFCRFPAQQQTLDAILASYNDSNMAFLFAQMQSGKTGIFLGLAIAMMHYGRVDNVYIMCGSNEVELHNQLKNDWENAQDFYTQQEFSTKETIRKISRNMNILKSSHMSAKKFQAIPRRSLVIWDECHFAQGVTNLPAQFLLKNGLLVSGTRKANELWAAKESYFLPVSATPFAPASCILSATEEERCMPIVSHKPAPCYRGVTELVSNFRASFSIAEQPEAFKALLAPIVDAKKYVLVRSAKNLSIIKAICEELGIDFMEYTHSARDLANLDHLAVAPAVTTVVGMKGMCRMGKVVPKLHIGLTFEESQGTNTDSILQSFVGRMCGHNTPADPYPATLPLIYIPKNFVDTSEFSEISRYLRFAQGEEILPKKAAHVENPGTSQAERTGLLATVPIVLPLLDEDADHYGDAADALAADPTLANDAQSWNPSQAARIWYADKLRQYLATHPLPDARQNEELSYLLETQRADVLEFHSFATYKYINDEQIATAAAEQRAMEDKWTVPTKHFKVYRTPAAEPRALYITARTSAGEHETAMEQKNALPKAKETTVFNCDTPQTALVASKPVNHDICFIDTPAQLEELMTSVRNSDLPAGVHTLFIHKSLGKPTFTSKISRGGKLWPKKSALDKNEYTRVVIRIEIEIIVRISTTIEVY